MSAKLRERTFVWDVSDIRDGKNAVTFANGATHTLAEAADGVSEAVTEYLKEVPEWAGMEGDDNFSGLLKNTIRLGYEEQYICGRYSNYNRKQCGAYYLIDSTEYGCAITNPQVPAGSGVLELWVSHDLCPACDDIFTESSGSRLHRHSDQWHSGRAPLNRHALS